MMPQLQPARRVPEVGRQLNAAFARAVLAGLAQTPKAIPCTWLYDRRGSELFEAITHLDVYYPTRTELAILDTHLAEMVAPVGRGAVVVEIGSGSSRKTPKLLRALAAPRAYVPVDIAHDFLLDSITLLARTFAGLHIEPIVADFTRRFHLPAALASPALPRLGFFPGSTIGNLAPAEAVAFLRRMAQTLGPDAHMLIGADCTRDPAVLLPAYDDPQGITAAFNLNLLERINRELGADFALDRFRHEARCCGGHLGHPRDPVRIEMHLVSRVAQTGRLLGREVHFAAGESIHTENSYKYSASEFAALANAGGWLPAGYWHDAQRRFAVHLLQLSPEGRLRH